MFYLRSHIHRIGWWENLQESPTNLMVKTHGFPVDFPLNQSIDTWKWCFCHGEIHHLTMEQIRTKATIAQSDLVGFTTLASSREPMEASESSSISDQNKLGCCCMLLFFFVLFDLFWSKEVKISQTSDNMDRWKAEVEQKNRREEQKREDQRRERVRRKKMQVREKVGKSRNTVFFPMICGSRGSKSRLAKAAGAEPSAQMRDEKLHAVVARSTFRSQNAQNAPDVGALLQVEMSKKCTPLWREADLEVKSVKNWRVRSTFGSWDALMALGWQAWQAWHLATSTFVLRGRRGTWWHPRFKWVHLSQIRLCHTQLCHAQSVTSLFHMQLYRTQLCQTQLFRTQLFHTQLSHTQLCHTQSFTHTHTSLSHATSLSHTSLSHNFVTHNFVTHNFVTHNLSYTALSETTLSYTTSHTQLFHSQFFTHNSFTHNLSHTTLSHTHNFLTHNSSHTTFKMVDPPPSPLSFLLSPCRFNHFFRLLEELDLWGYLVLQLLKLCLPNTQSQTHVW